MSLSLFLDENIPPRMAERMRESGYDVVHVGEVGPTGASDADVLQFARVQ